MYVNGHLGFALLFCGFFVLLPILAEKMDFLKSVVSFFDQAQWSSFLKTIIGIWGIVTGFISLITPWGGQAFFVGDLVSALLSLCVGLLLAMSFLKKEESLPQDKVEMVNLKLCPYRLFLGISALVFGLIHILLWNAVGSLPIL